MLKVLWGYELNTYRGRAPLVKHVQLFWMGKACMVNVSSINPRKGQVSSNLFYDKTPMWNEIINEDLKTFFKQPKGSLMILSQVLARYFIHGNSI